MRLVLLAVALVGCTDYGCEYEDERIDADDDVLGFTANQMTRRVETRTFEMVPMEGYGLLWSQKLALHGPFRIQAAADDERPFVRRAVRGWCPAGDTETLWAVMRVRITSADGAFDVHGRYHVAADSLDAIGWAGDGDALGLVGEMPGWVREAGEAEQEDHCPFAPGAEIVRVQPGGVLDAQELSVDVRYQEHGVCNYAALIAIGDLVPLE